mgnify:CR=1 FL=1|tara:strand:- start:42 stop:392 length:351 start_codon:yes stop_codon:yes gene_type:complete
MKRNISPRTLKIIIGLSVILAIWIVFIRKRENAEGDGPNPADEVVKYIEETDPLNPYVVRALAKKLTKDLNKLELVVELADNVVDDKTRDKLIEYMEELESEMETPAKDEEEKKEN